MKSPFPGMDPFLEQRWRDVHTSLMTYIREVLMEHLPEDLIAQIEEQVSIETFIPHAVRYIPDVSVVEAGAEAGLESGTTSTPVAETKLKPNPVILPVEPATKRHIEIVDFKSGDKVVTVIEVLSPANKIGEGRAKYIAKRDRFIEAGINVVEIDLIRSGTPVWPHYLESHSDYDVTEWQTYHIWVYRAADPEQYEVYGIALRDPLPPVAIPLRTEDLDIVLELQPIIDRCYKVGGYGRRINYGGKLLPPVVEEDAIWMADLLRPFS